MKEAKQKYDVDVPVFVLVFSDSMNMQKYIDTTELGKIITQWGK